MSELKVGDRVNMTKQEMLISLMRSNAMGERGKSRGSKTKRDKLVHAQCAEVWEDAAELVHEVLIPKLPEPAVVFNKRPTADNYLSLAEKFDEARKGDGPGIGEAELAEIGLKCPEDTDWESTCRYVWQQFKPRSEEPWPSSPYRGRGRHSRACGEHIVKLLKELAEDWRRNASPIEQLAECATNKEN